MSDQQREFRIHKTRGTSKFVNVFADRFEIVDGALVFWSGGRLVMAYAAWAWKTVVEDSNPGRP